MNESEIIIKNLERLIDRLSEEGVSIGLNDLHYSLLNREEWIYIESDMLYNGEDIPSQFGVYRGYGGGGIHTGAITTEIERMTKRRQAKAQRLLNIFKDTFNDILKEIDGLTDPATWDSATI